MILYVCSYVIRTPFLSESRIGVKEMGWEKLSNIVKNVYAVGGSVIIHKTDADYSEESGRLAYSDIDSYSMVFDSKYGFYLDAVLVKIRNILLVFIYAL